MSIVLTRTSALITLFAYLTVGTVAVRMFTTGTSKISFTTEYFLIFKTLSIVEEKTSELTVPEQKFVALKFSLDKISTVKKTALPKQDMREIIEALSTAPEARPETMKVDPTVLPFNEPVMLTKIQFNEKLLVDLISLYRPIAIEESLLASTTNEVQTVADEVSTKMAQVEINDLADPEFYDYSSEDKVKEEPIAEIVADTKKEIEQLPAPVYDSGNENKVEEVAIEDLVAFDYSKAKKDLQGQEIQKLSTVTIQSNKSSMIHPPAPRPGPGPDPDPDPRWRKGSESAVLTIQASGTDLKKVAALNNYEIRFHDDQVEILEDFGNGEIVIQEKLASPIMTRSVVLLKQGYAPTNTDIILERGKSALTLPMLETNKFNELLAPYEERGPVGMILIELDDETENAKIDVPFGKTIQLDGDMKITTSGDHRYELFIGVRAGNALITYKDLKGKFISKIVHIHEHELSFEPNIYGPVQSSTLALFEEDLLGKEQSPLIIAASHVKAFASDKESKKINDHTYNLHQDRGLLGSRNYIELGHQEEPVFVGISENFKASVPSENFMRYVLSRIEGNRLGERCLVQVNLTRSALKVDVGSESVADTLMTYTQVLDSDGKFYDSIGEKSRKILVVGENHGAEGLAKDAKINIKITYEDGSTQYLGSYCSPNTYLVEQL